MALWAEISAVTMRLRPMRKKDGVVENDDGNVLVGEAKAIYIVGNTVVKALATEAFDVYPASSGHISINGIPAEPGNVVYAHDRVDLASGPSRAYLVEHALALCALLGIHSAEIKGTEQSWNLDRPSHRVAMKNGHLPSDVLGESSGRICGTFGSVTSIAKRSGITTQFFEVTKAFSLKDQYGTTIELTPPRHRTNVSITISAGGSNVIANMDISSGIAESSSIEEILCSRSLAVTREWNDESLLHAAGDAISDLIWLSRVFADIKAKLGLYYHNAMTAIGRQIAAVASLVEENHTGQ